MVFILFLLTLQSVGKSRVEDSDMCMYICAHVHVHVYVCVCNLTYATCSWRESRLKSVAMAAV